MSNLELSLLVSTASNPNKRLKSKTSITSSLKVIAPRFEDSLPAIGVISFGTNISSATSSISTAKNSSLALKNRYLFVSVSEFASSVFSLDSLSTLTGLKLSIISFFMIFLGSIICISSLLCL